MISQKIFQKNKLFSIKKNWRGMGVIVLIIALFGLLFFPALSLKIGDMFFGRISGLYNVKFAQFFYLNSTYPLLPITPPPYSHYQLSRTYFIQGNLKSALEEARAELNLYPDNTKAYYILGLTYGYMNREREAIDSFSKYIETHPDTWAGRNDKAWLQFRIGDIDGALETIEPVAEKFRYNVWIQNTYCALLMNKKDYTRAKQACEYAKERIDTMNEKDWGQAYPGNDPRIYSTGLSATKKSIDQNIEIINKELSR